VPTRNVTSPGSTIRSIVRPLNDNRSECTVNVTSADSPTSKRTRANPISWVTGRVTLATGSAAYSWTTSSPKRAPVLRTVTVSSTLAAVSSSATLALTLS
jgi:hypothetical protein